MIKTEKPLTPHTMPVPLPDKRSSHPDLVRAIRPIKPAISFAGHRWRFLALFLACCLFTACSQNSAEEEIREVVKQAEDSVESGQLRTIRSLIADSYSDEKGNDKRSLIGLIGYQVLRQHRVYLLCYIQKIQFPTADTSQVELLVAMSGTPVTSKNMLADIEADIYQFRFTLQRIDKTWQLVSGDWQQATLHDMLSQ